MALTKTQWRDIAEAQAAAEYGKKYAGWFMFRRFLAGPVGVLVLAGAGGLGAYALWRHLPSVSSGSLSTGFWVIVALLAIGTFVVFRPGRFVPAALLVVRAVVVALLWLGVAVYGFVVLI